MRMTGAGPLPLPNVPKKASGPTLTVEFQNGATYVEEDIVERDTIIGGESADAPTEMALWLGPETGN